jgi:hypothetical protein
MRDEEMREVCMAAGQFANAGTLAHIGWLELMGPFLGTGYMRGENSRAGARSIRRGG